LFRSSFPFFFFFFFFRSPEILRTFLHSFFLPLAVSSWKKPCLAILLQCLSLGPSPSFYQDFPLIFSSPAPPPNPSLNILRLAPFLSHSRSGQLPGISFLTFLPGPPGRKIPFFCLFPSLTPPNPSTKLFTLWLHPFFLRPAPLAVRFSLPPPFLSL